MLIGQCGAAKSGNYLLYRILRNLLEQQGEFESYALASGCWDSLFRLNDAPLSFPEQRELDEFLVRDGGVVYLHNSHFKASFAPWNLEEVVRRARLLWTHQEPLQAHHDRLGRDRHWFYILRDGRDVTNSWMHFATTPRMLQRNPQYTARSAEDLYRQPGYFEKLTRKWAESVAAYLALRDRYRLVRYEALVADKPGGVERIAEQLGLKGRVDVAQAVAASSVETMRQDAPGHVRRARRGDWRTYFEPRHREAYLSIAGPVLERLGVPEYLEW